MFIPYGWNNIKTGACCYSGFNAKLPTHLNAWAQGQSGSHRKRPIHCKNKLLLKKNTFPMI